MAEKKSLAFYEENVSASKYLHSEWIKVLITDCDTEALEVSHIELVPQDGRNMLWKIYHHLDIQSPGVPGHACQILKRYLHILSVSYAKINDPTLRMRKIEKVQKQMPLIMTCCILLSSKMNSASESLSSNVDRLCLMYEGIRLSTEEINSTEWEIYSTLNFKIPLWNGADMATFLALQAKFPPHQMVGIELIMELAEYYKGPIESEVRRATCLPIQFRKNGGSNVRTLHLAAGAVAAATSLSRSPDISKDLAALIKVPEIYIRCLGKFILNQIKTDTPSPPRRHIPNILKRKRNMS